MKNKHEERRKSDRRHPAKGFLTGAVCMYAVLVTVLLIAQAKGFAYTSTMQIQSVRLEAPQKPLGTRQASADVVFPSSLPE